MVTVKRGKVALARAKATNGRRTKAETPIAVKAQGTKAISAQTGKDVIVMPKAGAMSVDIGLKVATIMSEAVRADLQIKDLTLTKTNKSNEVLAWLTVACVKAAKADPSIDLTLALGDDDDAKERVNRSLYLCTGLKTVQMVGEVGAQKPRVDWAPGKISEMLKINKKTDPTDVQTQKGTFRTNLAHQMTKAQKAALRLMDKDIKFTAKEGTLQISGPSVLADYGASSVLLNEKQTQTTFNRQGKATGEMKLKAKPSFADIARRASEARGKIVNRRGMIEHGAKAETPKDPNDYVIQLSGFLVKTIESMESFNDKATKALESVQSAIEEALS